MLAVEMLSRLGVGQLVVVDPDKVELTNLTRLPDAYPVDVRDSAAVAALLDCDFILRAADTAAARHIVNIISYQYLVPVVQVGVKIPVDDLGGVGDLFAAVRFAAVRPVAPDGGCLRCAGLIDSSQLAVDLILDRRERELADYGMGKSSPSVITLNAMAVSEALTHDTFALTGLNEPGPIVHIRKHACRGARVIGEPHRDDNCKVCGSDGVTALGDLIPLPLPRG